MTKPLTDAEALAYIASYADLRAAFGADGEAGRQHFQAFGQAEGRAISFSPLFYTAASADLIAAFGTDAVAAARHFIQYGADEGRTVRFDALSYIASNPDLIQAFGTDAAAGAEHYIRFGLAEQRPTASFDALGYIAANADLIAAFGMDTAAATRHFVQFGVTENRPMQFDAMNYIAANADLIEAFGIDVRAATDHYVRYGAAEQRTVTFGALEYLASNPDLITAFGTDTAAATRHYIQFGSAEGRPLAAFDPVAYLLSQPDLRAAGLGPDGALRHWVNFGFAEGRSGDATFGREQADHTLVVGQTLSSTFSGAGDHDWFRIDATTGQRVKVAMNLAQDTGDAPVIHAYDASGAELDVILIRAAAGAYAIAFTARAAGSVYLTAEAAGGYTGSYSLQAVKGPGLVTGTSGRDKLIGSVDDDFIRGLEDDDTLEGGAGNDVLEGGGGYDELSGGFGDDILYGNNAGNAGFDPYGDRLTDDQGGNDQLFGQDGSDDLSVSRSGWLTASTVLLDGGAGDDSLTFNTTPFAHRATLMSFMAGRFIDTVTMIGGTGDDRIFVRGALKTKIDGGSGNDEVTVDARGGSYSITLGHGSDVLTLSSTYGLVATMNSINITDFAVGADKLVLDYFLSDGLRGWDGATNPFAGGYLKLVQEGAHTLLRIDRDGGGDDFVTLLTLDNTTAASFTADDLGYAPDGSAIPGQTVVGSIRNDQLIGSAGDDLIQGLGEQDRLSGYTGNDILEGGAGRDFLNGGVGDDVLYGNNAGNTGSDEFSDELRDEDGGNDQLFGQDGNDTLLVSRQSYAAASTVLLDGGTGNDFLGFSGSRFADAVTMIGGPGDDKISVSFALQTKIDAGSGNDSVAIDTRGGSYTVTLGQGDDVLTLSPVNGAFGVGNFVHIADFIVGTDKLVLEDYLSDVLQGWDGSTNPFSGGFLKLVQEGTDTLFQIDRDGGGDDFATLLTFNNTNAASFTAGALGYAPDGSKSLGQTIVGTDGRDTLTGSAGDDLLQGFYGADVLEGRAGNDVLEGGAGTDTLDGGPGDDMLYGNNAGNTGSDVLSDRLIDKHGGNDQLFGQHGGDSLYVSRSGSMAASSVLLDGGTGNDRLSFAATRLADTVTMIGGTGDDQISVSSALHTRIDAGSGNDVVAIDTLGGSYAITLGGGADVLTLSRTLGSFAAGNAIHVTDFALGIDKLALEEYLIDALQGWDGSVNPFAGGFIKLVQSGADTLLQIDRDGGGDNLATLLTFDNTTATSFTANDLGYAPDGSAGGQGASGEVTAVLGDLYAGNDAVEYAGSMAGLGTSVWTSGLMLHLEVLF